MRVKPGIFDECAPLCDEELNVVLQCIGITQSICCSDHINVTHISAGIDFWSYMLTGIFFAHLSEYYNPLKPVTFLFEVLYRVDVKVIDQYWKVGGRKLEADKSHTTWAGIEPRPGRWEAYNISSTFQGTYTRIKNQQPQIKVCPAHIR
jgi:hypothetical protein